MSGTSVPALEILVAETVAYRAQHYFLVYLIFVKKGSGLFRGLFYMPGLGISEYICAILFPA
mgnify:CR=1 FL=1